MSKYPHLFSPFDIGPVKVRNRTMQTAHARGYAENGVESARDVAYFAERARGGAGLLTVGNQVVHPTGSPGRPGLAYTFMPDAAAALGRVADAVHGHGAKLFLQINHFGASGGSEWDDPRALWGPDRYTSAMTGEQTKGMDARDIAVIVAAFRHAAFMAREAGADGIEVHVAHGYLLNLFLSKGANHRTDDYGGSPQGRLKLVREVIAAVRDAAGPRLAVGARMSLGDKLPGGLDVDDTIAATGDLHKAGLLDFISVSMGAGLSSWHGAQSGYAEAGFLMEPITPLRNAVPGLPLFAVGGINDPAMAERILQGGQADMVAMTRAQIADPDLVRKVAEGREDEIVHCIRANQGCLSKIYRGMPMACSVNPAAGREQVFGGESASRTATPGRWLVVGGGPAGMKAAEGLALRGHQVKLVDAAPRLGGQITLACTLPGREPWRQITEDLTRRMRKFGVEIVLGSEATPESILSDRPDGVVLATGAAPEKSRFTTIGEIDIELGSSAVLTAQDALLHPEGVGRRVVLLDDEGSRMISGLAEILLARGVEVIVVTRFNALFPVAITTLEWATIYNNTLGRGLQDRLNHGLRSFRDGEAVVFNLISGREERLTGIDCLILGTKFQPRDALHVALKGRLAALWSIGDCLAARTLDHAIYEGFLAGREQLDWDRRPFFEGHADPRGAILVR